MSRLQIQFQSMIRDLALNRRTVPLFQPTQLANNNYDCTGTLTEINRRNRSKKLDSKRIIIPHKCVF